MEVIEVLIKLTHITEMYVYDVANFYYDSSFF